MSAIRDFLEGTMPADEFVHLIQTDETVREEVRQIIPEEARNHPEHPLWQKTSYSTHRDKQFDMIRVLGGFRALDGSLGGNLDLFAALRSFYEWNHPDCHFTTLYEDAYNFYLDVAQDCFDGPEVLPVFWSLFEQTRSIPTKAKRLKEAKSLRNEAFHVNGLHRPHWIQDPLWPMGQQSPMKFVKQTSRGEQVLFTFEDVDTGEIRVVEQYY